MAHPAWEKQGRPSERQQVYEERAGDLAGPVRREDPRKDHAPDIRGDIGGDRQQDGREGEWEGYRRVRWSEVMSPVGAGEGRIEATGHALQHEGGKPAPLVPAITRHDRSIEDVAREKAMRHMDHSWMLDDDPPNTRISLRLLDEEFAQMHLDWQCRH